MKKLFIIFLATMLFSSTVSANWDRVNNIYYWAWVDVQVFANYTLYNKACWTSHSWGWYDIFPYFNYISSNNEIEQYLRKKFNLPAKNFFSDYVRVGGFKGGYITKEYDFTANGKDITTKAWRLPLDRIKLKLTTPLFLVSDAKWRNDHLDQAFLGRASTNIDFWTFDYSDPSECVGKFTTIDPTDPKKTITKLPPSEPLKARNFNIPNINIVLKQGFNPGKINSISVVNEKNWINGESNCIQEGEKYYCYATDTLKLKIWTTPASIDGAPIEMKDFQVSTFKKVWRFGNTYCWYPSWDQRNNPNCNVAFFGKTVDIINVRFPDSNRSLKNADKDNCFYLGVAWYVDKNNISTVTNPESDWLPKRVEICIVPNLNLTAKTILKNEPIKNSAVANLADNFRYNFTIKDSFDNEVNKNISGKIFEELRDVEWFSKEDKLINWKIPNKLTDNFLELYSFNPLLFKEKFFILVNIWNAKWKKDGRKIDYIFNWESTNSKEFTPWVELSWISIDDGTKAWAWKPKLWDFQKYKFNLIDYFVNGTSIKNGNLELAQGNILIKKDENTWIYKIDKFEKKFVFASLDVLRSYLGFSLRFNIEKWQKAVEALSKVILEIPKNKLKISYDIKHNWFDWKARYDLSGAKLDGCEFTTLWVKVIWWTQSQWNAVATGQKSNISDLSRADLIWNISKNASNLTRWMKSWEILNGVKYIEWKTETISGNNLNFETIIVKNWNLFIENDLNTSGKKLWIIVLKDNYNVLGNETTWNIYISNNVKTIKASIFASWAIRSADKNWIPYSDDKLFNKLDILWTVFTKNTIWWAVVEWEYKLPGGKTTNDFELAQKFDLNFIRKVPLINCEDKDNYYSVKIEYDAKIQSNPPKGFSK